MKLNVITAASRPWNLSVIAGSLSYAHSRAPEVDLTWHLRFDPERVHVGGQALKNKMLDQISDGWVWTLDDDTLVHENLLRNVSEFVQSKPELRAVVVSQRRNDGRVLRACPENAVVGEIDAGQALLHVDLINGLRVPETYAGDGVWLESLLRHASGVSYLDEVLSLHNALSGVEVSEPAERMQA